MFAIIVCMNRTPNSRSHGQTRRHSAHHNDNDAHVRRINYPTAANELDRTPGLGNDRRIAPKRPSFAIRRVGAAVTAAGLAFSAAAATGRLSGNERSPRPFVTGAEAVAEPGDSIWSIVKRYHEGDPREAVDEITRQLGTSEIHAGETIPIPADAINIAQNQNQKNNGQ